MKLPVLLSICAACAEAQGPDPNALLRESLALARATRLSDAENLLRRSVSQFPDDKRFQIELAGVLYREHRNESAKYYLRRALVLDPSDAYAAEFLGTLYLLDGNLAAALKYWNPIARPLIQDVRVSEPDFGAVDLSGGQIFTLKRLLQTESNLDRLDVFSGYQFDLTARDDRRYDVAVRLDPVAQPFGGWIGRALPYLRGLPYETVDVDRYSIGGRAINFTSLWRWDANKRRIGAELSGPLRSDPRYRYRLVVDGRDEHWGLAALNSLRLRKIETGGDLILGLSGKLQWTTGIRTSGRWFAQADGNPVFNSGWSVEQRNRLDYRLIDWPEHRLKVKAAAALDAGRRFAGYATMRADLNAAWFPEPAGDRWEVDGRLRAGRTFGALPFDEYFQLGMERDNDLWFRGIAGTRDGLKGSAPLGTNYALVQTDVQRTWFRAPFVTLKAGPFFDTGRISGPSGQFGSQGWMQAAGIQVRIATFDRLSLKLVYGRDLRTGQGVFYTAVTR